MRRTLERAAKFENLARAYLSSRRRGTPAFVRILPTDRCNLDCAYCWQRDDASPDMTLEAFRQYLDCGAGERACPPEDVGGTSGYEHLIEVMADPKHEEYEDLSGWVSEMVEGPFDPEKFDMAAVNKDLKRLR